jgi:hypothetical protein
MNTLLRLGVLEAQTGRLPEASVIFQESKEKLSRIYGPAHPATWDASYGLAVVLRAQGEYNQARIVARQLLDAQEQVLAPTDPILVRTADLLRAIDDQTGSAAAGQG